MKKTSIILLFVTIAFASCTKENDDKYPLYPPMQYFFCDSIYLTPAIYVPSAFTPNGDGINDIFTPTGNRISLVSIVVFESLESGLDGKEVYIYGHSNNFNPWKGENMDGQKCPTGSYPYRIKYVTSTGESDIIRGVVNLYEY